MSDDLIRPVAQFFESLTARDFVTARKQWDDHGVWHLDGQHDLIGDYDADDYLRFLEGWFADHPDYRAVDLTMQQFGDDVIAAHLVTQNGRYAGTASGLMVFRLAHGRIAEGWAIPTFAGGAHPF